MAGTRASILKCAISTLLKKICTKQKLDNDLNNNEQLFNRQFLSLSHPQTDELCRKKAQMGE